MARGKNSKGNSVFPIAFISKIVGLDLWEEGVGNRWKSKLYCVFVAFIIFVLAIVSFIGRWVVNYSGNVMSSVILDIACNAILLFLNIYSIFKIGIFSQAKLKQMGDVFNEIDRYTNRYVQGAARSTKTKSLSSKLPIKTALIHGYYLIILLLNTQYFLATFGFDMGKFFMFRGVQQYYMIILVLILHHFAVSLKNKFTNLHVILLKTCTDFNRNRVAKISNDINREQLQNKIRQVCNMYGLLLDNIAQFNKVFGYIMLAIPVRIVLEALLPLNMMLLWLLGDHWKPWYVFIWGTLWLVLSSVLVVLLAKSCNHATKEARRTIAVAYTLIHELSCGDRSDYIKTVRADLFLLAQQTYVRSPIISAAGFFSVDYTMLFTLIGCVTSYFIVLIQFNK